MQPNNLNELRESVIRRADSLNHLVILKVLDQLDKIVEEAYYRPLPGCSYAANLGKYVSYKLILHHLTSQADREDWRMGAHFYDERRHQLSQNLEMFHAAMHRNPCHQCSVCRGRRKPWPKKPVMLQDRSYREGKVYGITSEGRFELQNARWSKGDSAVNGCPW